MMHAQRHSQSEVSAITPELARRLLAANADYGRSNDPDLPLATRLQARQRARVALEDILAEHPDHGASLSLMGRVELDGGRLDEARALFDRSLEREPANAQCHTNLGYWALVAGDAGFAERCFLEALGHDRQSAAAFCGIAHARRQQGEFDVAYLHYRKLLEMGLAWPSIYSGMMECATRIEIHRADQDLARDAIGLLRQDQLPHQDLGTFICALLRQQYDLDTPHGEVYLDVAAGDELLLLALERTLLPDPAVEKLLTLLRNALCDQTFISHNLADRHQRLAIALGLYAERTGYALIQSDAEAARVRAVNDGIAEMLAEGASAEQIAGSVIISAMYGALFNQRFAAALGHYELADWAEGLRPLIAASYTHKAEEEAYKQNFAEKEDELALAPEDVSHAWPSWANLRAFTQRSLNDEFHQTLGVQLPHADPVRVLLLGCGSGQRALEIAHYYTDVEVIAVDEELANLAHGARRARESGLENIVFWPYSLARRFVGDGYQVQFIELGQRPSARHGHEHIVALIEQALSPGGLVHFNTGTMAAQGMDRQIQTLARDHRLASSTESVRRLRRMILNNHQDAQWQEILKSPDFYATAGCRRRWFFPEDGREIQALLSSLGNEVEWRLIKARDADGHDLAAAPVQAQLLAERHGNDVQSLTGQSLNLYFQKRR